ncbi:hypothetical protein VTL71DRAFT_8471 [Oculimacula yallundae]|uniref:Heterokaryon incompatibility domain-containing protein n=1 Tax=Oculimacula yallundae TaxID=86028 RepID=A0ABR4CXW1_9HELO
MSDTDPDIVYATLSHCWVKAQYTVLKKETLHLWLNKIPSEAISVTFSDAISTCRYLGFQYIWIDSLCIIQNSVEDWTKEASTMSNVYSRSGLNISAAAALDGSAGCFIGRKDSWRCSIKCSTSTGLVAYRTAVSIASQHSDLDNQPLMKRGWAIQERVLAPRTLQCAETQLFWECREGQASESIPSGYDKERVMASSFSRTELSTSTEIWLAIKFWVEILTAYSICRLTETKDALVAISGLALATATLNPVLGDYVAGLFRNEIEYQLCWQNKYSDPRWTTSRPKVYRAPTWSWASVDGPKYFGAVFAPFTNSYVAMQEVLIELTDPQNPYGEVTSGLLALSCELMLHCTATLSTGERKRIEFFVQDICVPMVVHFDSIKEQQLAITTASSLFLLPVGRRSGGNFKGLLLQATGAAKGQYTRSGVFDLYHLIPNKGGNATFDYDELLSSRKGRVDDSAYAKIETNSRGDVLKIIHIL